MTVFHPENRGKTTETWYYRFMLNGKNYNGTCKGCQTEAEAREYEHDIKKDVSRLIQQKTVRALVENFREELSGGKPITLEEAIELVIAQPGKRIPAERQVAYKRTCWQDFIAYMKSEYPDVTLLNGVRKAHASAYIGYLRKNGRFCKTVSFVSPKGKKAVYISEGELSPRTINVRHAALKEVFNKLAHDAGLMDNPFKLVDELEYNSTDRESFSQDELALIGEKLTPFIRPIFIIGTATELREGDICTLRWREIDLKHEKISRTLLKTLTPIEIPIMPPLKSFLMEQIKISGDNEFVLPDHAVIYQKNPSGISYRVKDFLESLGIKTTKVILGRTRAISIKDVHSLRHTFCYYAGVYGIPINIVQSIVGHMTPEMTKHYQAHADLHIKRHMLSRMPDFLKTHTPTKEENLRQQIKIFIDSANLKQLSLVKKVLGLK